MNFRLLTSIACAGVLLTGSSAQVVYAQVVPSPDAILIEGQHNARSPLSVAQLQSTARSITVKVASGQSWGSGILIEQQGSTYTVLTNEHVLRLGNSYQISTPDGRVYPAQVQSVGQFGGDDLALLQFNSAQRYPVATLASASAIALGEATYASGFPADRKEFTFTTGRVSYLLPQPFKLGYQLGYSNDIFKGMSGGPVLNRYGEVVGINGKHKYPLWGNTYIFKDNSTPTAAVRKEMDASSWAIPIQTFLRYAPEFTTLAHSNAPFPGNSTPISIERNTPAIATPTESTPDPAIAGSSDWGEMSSSTPVQPNSNPAIADAPVSGTVEEMPSNPANRPPRPGSFW
ncbi:S1 family peptidase [Roseofilum casamattae]|uniref:Serine protease n=1 Tax=Roseofilum casamattae BLCC-M143 TaxID=3022442 RepID=A0ABT7BQY0_9CYAN|nr:serine protease [Roseofilum casamattae]MDJ1181604.1 serine protease [Roseofilum casamattae BLCC-M143]